MFTGGAGSMFLGKDQHPTPSRWVASTAKTFYLWGPAQQGT